MSTRMMASSIFKLKRPTWWPVADREGWGVFDSGMEVQIQRDDEADKFESDLHALGHVLTCAARDEEGPHYAALVEWRRQDPESYRRNVQAFVDLLPQPA